MGLREKSVELSGGYGRTERAMLRVRRKLGEVIKKLVQAHDQWTDCRRREGVVEEGADRLTEDEITELKAFEEANLTAQRKEVYGEKYPVEKTPQGLGLNFLDEILQSSSPPNTVVDVAVRYAVIIGILAERHPSRSFVGVSVADGIEAYNREWQRENVSFRRGYALDLIESGQLLGDCYFFSSTAAAINNPELARYFRAIHDAGGSVVINEPVFNGCDGRPVDPAAVDVEASRPALEYEHCWIHNYGGLAEHAGFSVTTYRVFPVPRNNFYPLPPVHWCQMYAEHA